MKEKKEITLNDIAELIKLSAQQTEKKLETKITESAKRTTEALEAKIKDSAKTLEAKIKDSAKRTTETLEAKIEESTEILATMSQKQFLELGDRMTKVERKLNNIESEIIKKVDKIDHNTLTYRVKKLEEKIA